MKTCHCILLVLASAIALAQAPPATFRGCLNRRPDGTLQLGVRPSGKLFLLQGDPNVLQEHVNHLVQITGHSQASPRPGPPTLTVDTIQLIAESCAKTLPTKKPQPVPGKVGEDALAVPVTTTKTADETTPGVQTETGMSQSPGAKRPPRYESRTAGESPYAPVEPEQIAQSEAAANVNAEAAYRAEILPGNTLGVSGSPSNPTSSAGFSALSRSAVTQRSTVVTITGDSTPELSSVRLTIAVGQMVEWRNSSAAIYEIIANPVKTKGSTSAQLPAGAEPFDSGFLRPNSTFSYRFTVPGVYRYVCDHNGSQQASGEIVVGQ